MDRESRIVLIAILSIAIGACHAAPRTAAAAESPSAASVFDTEIREAQSDVHHYFSKTEHKHDVVWGYKGARGPDSWATLSPKYKLAKDGKRQSPIDIQTKKAESEQLPPLRFDYHKDRISAINNGHTIQHNGKPGSFLRVGDVNYALEQFHVHVPSEHTIDGRHTALEIHFVHKSKLGEVAVVAVMVQPGTKEPVKLPRYKEIPKKRGEKVEVEGAFRNLLDFIPKDHSYFSYTGSFTTPPCTEGVRWIVMASSVEISPDAIAGFNRTIGGNNRPVQPLFGRRVIINTNRNQDN